MGGRRVDVIGQAELLDPPEPLEPGMFDQVEDGIVGDGDEPVNGVIDVFAFVSSGLSQRGGLLVVLT